MIIRSGFIRNREGVSKAVFDRHWQEVHGPLARAVPTMRAYAQNHVIARLVDSSDRLHRIDGISQLWFDDVAAMRQAMASPEQAACVEDIKGFLEQVTVAIQSPGQWTHFGERLVTRSKVMAVYAGDPGHAAAFSSGLCEWFGDTVARGGSLRLNQVIERGYVVARDVPRGDDVVAAIAELWFNDPEEVLKARTMGPAGATAHSLECISALHVDEVRILEPLPDASGL